MGPRLCHLLWRCAPLYLSEVISGVQERLMLHDVRGGVLLLLEIFS